MKTVRCLMMFALLAIVTNGVNGVNLNITRDLRLDLNGFNKGNSFSHDSFAEDKTTMSNCAVIANAEIEKKVSEFTVSISSKQEDINPMGYEFLPSGVRADQMNVGTQIFQECKTWNLENCIAAICLPEGIKVAFIDMAKLFVVG